MSQSSSSSPPDDILVEEHHHYHHHQQSHPSIISLGLNLFSHLSSSEGGGGGGGGDLIEGIGNEVLVGFVALITLITILGCLFVTDVIRRFENVSRVSGIHPSNLIAVNDARQQQQQHEAAAAAPFLPGTRTRFGTMDSNCPVCLNQLTLPIETNCGHLFCGRCIIIYWQHAQWRGGAIRCPVCRQGVNILLPCFSTAAAAANNNNGSNSSSTTSITQSLGTALLTATSELLNYLLSFLSSWSGGAANSSPSPAPSPSAPSAPSAPEEERNIQQQQTRAANGGSYANGRGGGMRTTTTTTSEEQQQPDDLLNPNERTTTSTTTTTTSSSGSSSTTAPPDPNAERTNVIREINTYNRRFSGEPRPWSDYLYDLPTLLRHLTNDFFSFNGLMYMFRIRIVLCVVAAIMYLISPLDMIPEAVFGIFGLFDDIVILLLLAIYVTIIYRRFLSSRWEMVE